MAVTLDTLTQLPRYQEAPFDAKIQSLDNLGNQMFQEGRLDEIPSVFQYKAQIELGRDISQDALVAPMMENMYDNLMGLRGTKEGKIRAMVGSEALDAADARFQQQVGDIVRPAKALEVEPGEFVFARKNPFGPGTLIETAGEPKFYEEGFQSDELLLEQVKADGLGTIRKNASFSKLNSELPSFDRVGDLMRSNDWQTQSQGDRRELMRKYAWEKQTQGDLLGAQEANAVRMEMDKQWEQTRNASGFAPQETEERPGLIGRTLGASLRFGKIYDEVPLNTSAERIGAAAERGWGQFQQKTLIKKIDQEFSALQNFRLGLTKEQRDYLENPEFRAQFDETVATATQNNILYNSKDDSNPNTPDFQQTIQGVTAGTPLDGVDAVKLYEYAQVQKSYKLNETEYDLRSDAMKLIGQTKGMQQFSQMQAQLQAEGKLGDIGQLGRLVGGALASDKPGLVGVGENVDNLVDIVGGVTLESFISQPITTAATTALFAIPVAGQTAGATAMINLGRGGLVGLMSGMEDHSATYVDEIEQHRTQADGTKIPLDVVLSDYEAMRQISEKAVARGVAIGTVEGVTGFMLPGMMGQLERFLITKNAQKAIPSRVARAGVFNTAQVGIQFGSEIGEESLAQWSTAEANIGEVLLEGVGGAASNFASMYQPLGLPDATTPPTAEELLAMTEVVRLGQEVQGVLSGEPVTTDPARPGIYARGLIPQIEIGEADAEGNATISVYVDEPGMEAEGAPAATVEQGLEETVNLPEAVENESVEEAAPIEEPGVRTVELANGTSFTVAPETDGRVRINYSNGTSSLIPEEDANRIIDANVVSGGGLRVAQEEVVAEPVAQVEEEPVVEAPIPDTYTDISSVTKGSKISWLTNNGELRSGTVRSRNVKNGTFITKDGLTRFRPGQMFKGPIAPKKNTEIAEIGDVLSTGDAFYRATGDGNYIVGQRIDGEIIFDPTDIVSLPNGIANDPRVKIYDKVAFEQAKAQFDARENPGKQDKFGPILATVPEKREKGSSPTPVALEPVVNETTGEETLPTPKEVEVAVAQPVIPSQRTTLFSLKTHKDMATLLAAGVNRLTQWFQGTRILEETPNSMRFVKDGREQQIFRTQDPENFDAVVAKLKEEDKFARAEKAPENWTEVPEYRELERLLNERVRKTQARRGKRNQTVLGQTAKVEDSPVLSADEISSILTTLFIQDRAIAAAASARFELHTPNASLITISDVAKLRYRNIANNDALKLASFTPAERLIKIGHSATIIDVFHEMYHDYLANIAPLVLSSAQFSQLKSLIEAQFQNQALIDFFGATGGPYAKFVVGTGRGEKRVFTLAEGASFYDSNGNISELAQETFTQMMTKFHWNSGPLLRLSPEDQASLEQVNQFYQRTFSDLNTAPIPVVSDEAVDLFENFFLTPPPFRMQEFDANPGTGPETNQSQRIDDEAVAEMENLDTLGAVLRGEVDEAALGEPEEKPTVKGVPPPTELTEEGTELSSERPDPEYRIPRLNRRVLDGSIGQSESLQAISRTQVYPEAPNEVVEQKVQARLAAQGNLVLALRDLAKLRNMSSPQLNKEFDPENRYGGIGQSSLTAYAKAILENLDRILVRQERKADFDFDKDQVVNMIYSVQVLLQQLNRETGRAVQINSIGEQLTAEQQIEVLESQLVRNGASYKKFISDARNFREKYAQQVPDMSEDQLKAAMQAEGISPIFAPAIRRFASRRATLRDLKADADEVFKRAGLDPFVKKPVRDLIADLSKAAIKYKDSPYLREMFSQWTHMVIEKERGTGLLNVLNAAAYNNLLLAPSTGMINVTGSTAKYFADLLTFYGAWVAGDFKQHSAEAISKNLEALVYGLEQGVKNMPQGIAEMSGIAVSGYRGNSVEAFSKAIGAINNTQTLMYGRAGTDANTYNVENSIKRIAGILLTDAGRRLATAPDAFMKVVADNTIVGAELYREAYDEWNLNKAAYPSAEQKAAFISKFIDDKLALKPLQDYYTLADAIIAENAGIIEQTSVSVLPSKKDLKILRDLIAFNLRREDRDSKLDPTVIKDAQRASFGISYSNETRGAFKIIERAARSVLDLGINTRAGQRAKNALDRTYVINAGPIKDYRLRIGTASPLGVAISPFLGNVMRQAEEMMNWTGLGVLNMAVTNALNVDPESTYSKMEVASAWVKTGLGLGALTGVLFALGAWDDDEDQTKGLTGNVDRRFMGRNGKETIVPAYSYWYISDKGDIGYVPYKDYPQAMFFFGVPATFAQMAKKDPEGTKQGAMLLYSAQSMLAVTTSMGMYDPVIELASFFNGQGTPESKAKLLQTSLGKWARTYANPLNRLQKEILGMQRGYQVLPPKGTFWETFVANTYLEGALSAAQSKELQKLVSPKGEIKEPQFFERFGGIIRDAPEGMKWMLRGGLTIQRTDYKKPIATFFPTTKDTDEQASAIFAKMNSGMFYAEHADEIEKVAASQYWPWIDAYSANEERKKEIETFYNSKTNQLRKEQNSPQFKTIKSLTQTDINNYVTQARKLAALKVASEYYTDSPKVRLWVDMINATEAAKGVALPDLKINPLLENPE